MKIIKQNNPPKVVDAKKELERISSFVNSEKGRLESIGRECDSKLKALSDINSKIDKAQKTLENTISMERDSESKRIDTLNKLTEKLEELDVVEKKKTILEVEMADLRISMMVEREKIENHKKKTLLEIEAVSRIEEMKLEDAKKRKQSIEVDVDELERKKLQLGKIIDENSKEIDSKLTNLADLHRDYLNGESKLAEMKEESKINKMILEEQEEKLKAIRKEIDSSKLELKEISSSLGAVRKEAQDAKESILKSVSKEEYIEKASKKIKDLYRRAGIEINI